MDAMTSAVSGPIRCPECGYSRRGLPAGAGCPECGHVPHAQAIEIPATTAWRVMVCVGLWLLLALTLDAVASVLVQRDWGQVLGTLPSLNVAGPKLWAVPLLQRPVGNTPQTPGIVGTRTAMLSLLAIWLITARRPTEREQGPDLLRIGTRWVSVALFGAAFGALVSQQGLWPNQLPPYRLILVAGVELPATVLLYLYFRRLCESVPGRERRQAFDWLVWMVPVSLAVSIIGLGIEWIFSQGGPVVHQPSLWRAATALVLGTMSMVVGVAATAAVGSLGAAIFLLAFPNAWRLLTGMRYHTGRLLRSAGKAVTSLGNERLRTACAAAGLVLLMVVMLIGIDTVGWFTARKGLAGNLPFYNYAGPKVWAATAVPELTDRYWWDSIVSRTMLVALNLVALWLITAMPLPSRRGRQLGRALRWLPVALLGAALGCASMLRTDEFGPTLAGPWRSEVFAAVTLVCELPPTLLLYLYLSRLCVARQWPELARRFIMLAVIVTALTVTAMLTFVLSRPLLEWRTSPLAVTFGGLYGAVMLVIAVWAVSLMLTLAWRLARHAAAGGDGGMIPGNGEAHEHR